MQHAVLSPSAAHRWLLCPGSIRMERLVPEAAQAVGLQPHVAEGTHAHTLAEIEAKWEFRQITHGQYARRKGKWRRETPEQHHEEMQRYVEGYVKLLVELAGEHAHSQVLIEQRVQTGVPGCWGTADAVILAPGALHVIDLKYGKGVLVEAPGNPQTRLYALGALHTWGELIGDLDKVCTTIYQPRVHPQSSHECADPDELLKWRDQEVRQVAELILDPEQEAYLNPGPVQCRFCPAAGICKARAEWALAQDFGGPDALTLDELGGILGRIDDIRKWTDQVREEALRRMYVDEEEVPGWKVVRSAGNRVITDKDAAIKVMVAAGLELDKVRKIDTATLATLDRLAGGRPQLQAMLGELLQTREGKISLAPVDDPRPAVTATASAVAEFENLPIGGSD